MRLRLRASGFGLWAAAALLASGCAPRSANPAATDERLILAGVVDEADALAWSGQVEGAALDLLLRKRVEVGAKRHHPSHNELCREPAKFRGGPAAFRGKLVAVEKFEPGGECQRLGKLYKGVVLLADGALVAFRCPAELPRLAAKVQSSALDLTVKLPGVDTPVTVSGFFLKRWVALDARGGDYVVMPLLAAHSVTKLAGPEAGKLARTRLGKDLLPLKEIHAPEVWSRPVVELARNGALRLDGKLVTWKKLEEQVAIGAAKYRNPLGDSALAVVVLADPRAPEAAVAKLKKLPAAGGAKCVLRRAEVPLR